jgi:hypothetical protein
MIEDGQVIPLVFSDHLRSGRVASPRKRRRWRNSRAPVVSSRKIRCIRPQAHGCCILVDKPES